MKKISRYVFGKFSRVFVMCLVTVLTIYLIVDFFEKLRKFLKYDADLTIIFSFFVYRIPEIAFLLAPLAALMASILTVGGLNRTREITAMRSCGLSFYQISIPFFIFGGLVSVVGLSLTAVLIPLANIKAEFVQSVLIQNKPEPLLLTPERLWLRVGRNHLLRIDSVTEDGFRLNGIHQYTLDDRFGLTAILEGEWATFVDEEWMMEHAIERTFPDEERMQVNGMARQALPLFLTPDDFQNWLAQSPEHMSLYQLHDYIQRVKDDGHSPHRFLTDYWARIAYSLVPLVMILLGISVSLRGSGVREVGVAKGLGQTLVIGFFFWAAHSIGIVLGRNGAVLPIIGSWIATVMFLIIGVNLFLKLK
ncbi:MAG: LPS export ABC transporter permease LptG [Nitrospirales bacterium]|nr:LPS export ABC transporter permease LptG [Nitrospira sp.]MDR4460064.1 LPS export ABC transporter permease LptG [Nitrospirales bacterium]